MRDSVRTDRRRSVPGDTLELSELLETVRLRRTTALVVGALVLVLGLAWTTFRAPVYRASATVKLEGSRQGSGVLSDIAALTSATAAEGEISILHSRALIEETVAEPSAPAEPEHREPFVPARPDEYAMDGTIELGLTTRVEALDRLPIRDLTAALGARRPLEQRLFATIEATTEDAPRRVRVSFPAADRVRLAIPGRVFDGDAAEEPYVRGQELLFHGARLRLAATGDYVGSEHLVERVPLEDCVESVAGRVDVEETARNSGVIRVTVSDSDPYRAAEIANALCHNYLLRSLRIGRTRADLSIEFIDRQLAEQQRMLEEAEGEVVALQEEHPELIQVAAAATSLLERLTEMEGERSKISLARAALAEAADLLEKGDRGALARLSRELPDLVSLAYIEAIGKLGGESLVLERTDAGATKLALAQKLDELALARHASEQELAALESALATLRPAGNGDVVTGDTLALAKLFAAAPTLAALDPSTAEYLTECGRIEAELSALSGDLTEENPRVVALRASERDLVRKITARLESAAVGLRLACEDRAALEEGTRATLATWPAEERGRIEEAVAELMSRVAANLRARVESLASQQRDLDDEIAGVERELGSLPERERAVADPLRRREAHAQIVKLLLDSRQQAQLSAAATLPAANLVDPAIPPGSRAAPRVTFHAALFAVLGVGAGILAALLRQALSGAVHTQAEVEELTGLAVFGSIPDFRHGPGRRRHAGARYLSLLDDPDGPLSEPYRSVRENLRSVRAGPTGDRPLRTLGITSCVSGEGKTTTNLNLAIAIAKAEKRVLLVDADLRKASVHRALDLPAAPGLAEVLEGRAAWRDCVRPSRQPCLDVLCAGEPETAPGDLLATGAIGERIAEFASEYDLVVFDMPPALAVADAEILARELDGVLLLYRSGGVHGDALVAAARKLRRVGANVLGALVNATRASRRDARYGYGYGYGSDAARRRRSADDLRPTG